MKGKLDYGGQPREVNSRVLHGIWCCAKLKTIKEIPEKKLSWVYDIASIFAQLFFNGHEIRRFYRTLIDCSTESGCQWCLCMLASELTVHMLRYRKRTRLLSSHPWLLPSSFLPFDTIVVVIFWHLLLLRLHMSRLTCRQVELWNKGLFPSCIYFLRLHLSLPQNLTWSLKPMT